MNFVSANLGPMQNLGIVLLAFSEVDFQRNPSPVLKPKFCVRTGTACKMCRLCSCNFFYILHKRAHLGFASSAREFCFKNRAQQCAPVASGFRLHTF
jgi:hypothetical protein